jgi:hypothetical protein
MKRLIYLTVLIGLLLVGCGSDYLSQSDNTNLIVGVWYFNHDNVWEEYYFFNSDMTMKYFVGNYNDLENFTHLTGTWRINKEVLCIYRENADKESCDKFLISDGMLIYQSRSYSKIDNPLLPI